MSQREAGQFIGFNFLTIFLPILVELFPTTMTQLLIFFWPVLMNSFPIARGHNVRDSNEDFCRFLIRICFNQRNLDEDTSVIWLQVTGRNTCLFCRGRVRQRPKYIIHTTSTVAAQTFVFGLCQVMTSFPLGYNRMYPRGSPESILHVLNNTVYLGHIRTVQVVTVHGISC